MQKILKHPYLLGLVLLVLAGLVLGGSVLIPGKTVPPPSSLAQASLTPGPVVAGSGEYLALGDSVAFGVGASSPQQLGYAGVFYQKYLKPARPDITAYQNFAIPGETTDSFIGRAKSQSQLERTLAYLDTTAGAGHPVKMITLTIGGNDVVAGRGLNEGAKQAILTHFETNFETILKQLTARAASPAFTLIVTTYYNPFAFNPTPSEKVEEVWVGRFNDIIRRQAARYGAKVADFLGPVQGHEKDFTRIAQGDIHPNELGHAALAEAVWQVIRNEKI